MAETLIEHRALGIGQRKPSGDRRILCDAVPQLLDQLESRGNVELEEVCTGRHRHLT